MYSLVSMLNLSRLIYDIYIWHLTLRSECILVNLKISKFWIKNGGNGWEVQILSWNLISYQDWCQTTKGLKKWLFQAVYEVRKGTPLWKFGKFDQLFKLLGKRWICLGSKVLHPLPHSKWEYTHANTSNLIGLTNPPVSIHCREEGLFSNESQLEAMYGHSLSISRDVLMFSLATDGGAISQYFIRYFWKAEGSRISNMTFLQVNQSTFCRYHRQNLLLRMNSLN